MIKRKVSQTKLIGLYMTLAFLAWWFLVTCTYIINKSPQLAPTAFSDARRLQAKNGKYFWWCAFYNLLILMNFWTFAKSINKCVDKNQGIVQKFLFKGCERHRSLIFNFPSLCGSEKFYGNLIVPNFHSYPDTKIAWSWFQTLVVFTTWTIGNLCWNLSC